MVISAALGFAAGIGITLLLQRRRRVLASKRTPKESSIVLNAPQLLAWIDAATQGWMILAPDHSIAYINDRAERLLHIPLQSPGSWHEAPGCPRHSCLGGVDF